VQPTTKSGPRATAARPALVGLVAVVAGILFVALRLHSYDWNPTGFVHAGGRFVDPAAAPHGLIVRAGEVGFDGAGYYRLALNPFTSSANEHGIELDLPAFRQQRIMYPLIAWAASFGGRPGAVPWALIAVNVAALFAVAVLGAMLARALGRSAWWGLALAAYPGFAVALGLDTAEIVAASFALGGAWMLVRSKPGWATACLVAAMLTRETTLLFALGVGVAWAIERGAGRKTTYPATVFAIPISGYVIWQALLWARWGELPLARGSGLDISVPLLGLAKNIPSWPTTDAKQAAFHYILAIAIAVFFFVVCRDLFRSRAPGFIRFSAASALVLSLLLSEAIWLHHWGFLRAFSEPYLLGSLVLFGTDRVRLDRLMVGSCALWVAIAVNLVAHP
jgi:hypothetical protein